MKRGEHVVVDVEGLTPKGDGLAIYDGREIVVERAVPGDRAEVYLRRKRRGRFEAVIEEILVPGLPRIDPPCVHFGYCGGCRWQDLEYGDQLKLKERLVREAFARRQLAPLSWRSILPSPDVYHYRNKMEFSFGTDRHGGLQLGLHLRGRYNRVFDLESCRLQSEASDLIVDRFRAHAARLDLPVYDLHTHEGLLRFLVVREGKGSGQTLVNLVVSDYPHDGVDDLLAAAIDDLGDRLTACVVTRHSGKAQVAMGEETFAIKGEGHIWENCGGLEFVISPRSFFQTNTRAASRLYASILDLAGDLTNAKALDLYAGTGGVSLHLARTARSVVGIEQVAEAVEDARCNALHNGLDNCTFLAGRAEDVLADLGREAGRRFDVVVADPPRAGIHRKALEGLVDLGATVVIYVSCNPESLGEDLLGLVAGGYALEVVEPVEMFPHTPHCEAVARLCRSPGWRPRRHD